MNDYVYCVHSRIEKHEEVEQLAERLVDGFHYARVEHTAEQQEAVRELDDHKADHHLHTDTIAHNPTGFAAALQMLLAAQIISVETTNAIIWTCFIGLI